MDDFVRRAKLLATLTERQRDVVKLSCARKLNKQIAEDLHITPRTVLFHKSKVYEKLGIAELQDSARLSEFGRFCFVLDAVGFEGAPAQPTAEDDEPSNLPSPPTRALAAVINDDRDLARRLQEEDSAQRKPTIYQPPNRSMQPGSFVPVPEVAPRQDRFRFLLVGVLGGIAVLLIVLIAVVLRGSNQTKIIQEVVAVTATQAATSRATLPPTPVRTPQPVPSPTFATNVQDIGCYERPDATSSAIGLPAGTVQTLDQEYVDEKNAQWYHYAEKQCWVMAAPGVEQLFSTRGGAESAAAKFRPVGAVLFQADFTNGLQGWTAAPGWKTLNGQLLSDGTNTDPGQWLLAPFHPGDVTDYAVEMDAEVIGWTGTNICLLCSFDGSYGIAARVTGGDGGYAAGRHVTGSTTADLASELWRRNKNDWNSLSARKGDLPSGRHVHRIEVQGNQVRYLVDGVVMDEATDNSFLTGGQIGLWSNKAQLTVYSFKVIKL
jgi:DNA-binding CsgD family transcriptional regulator